MDLTGTHEGEFQGIAPTGRRINITGLALARIENGKVAEERVYSTGLRCWNNSAQSQARCKVKRNEHRNSGVAGIEKDAPRPGRMRQIDPAEIVRKTTQEKPDNATHRSTRSMVYGPGISALACDEFGRRRKTEAVY